MVVHVEGGSLMTPSDAKNEPLSTSVPDQVIIEANVNEKRDMYEYQEPIL